MSKEALVFAALEHIAEKVGATDLAEYLRHSSIHSSAFQEEIDKHHSVLDDLDAFKKSNWNLTHASETKTYSQAQIDAMVADAVKKAMAEAAKDSGGKV